MAATIITAAFAAFAFMSSPVLGQTTSSCDPTAGQDCPNDVAFGGDSSYDFTSKSTIADLDEFWMVDDGVKYHNETLTLDKTNGASFTIYGDENAPTIISRQYIFFGKLEVTLQAAPGQGIITSIVLQSDDRDEIDWEFVGSHQSQVETNFYSKGVNDYTHAKKIDVDFNPEEGLHVYALDWTPTYITFSIDGKVIRTATPAEVKSSADWPQTPAQIRLGTWPAGCTTCPQGTVDWAGGRVDWSKAPYIGIYKSLKVTDYGGGYSGAKEYVWEDKSGLWTGIRADGGVSSAMPSLGGSASSSTIVSSSPTSSPTTTSSTRSTGTSATTSATTSTTTSESNSNSSTTTHTSTTSSSTKSSSQTSAGTSTSAPAGNGASTVASGLGLVAGAALLLHVLLI